MRLLDALRGESARGSTRSAFPMQDVGDYASAMGMLGGYGFGSPIQQTMAGQKAEPIPSDFIGLAQNAYKRNGVIFACMLVRQQVFSAVRFAYQRLNSSKPSELFGTTDLSLLEVPWVGGTTQDLLTRTIQDADLAGNSYWTLRDGELVRLRPDWVQIVLEARDVDALPKDGVRTRGTLGWKRLGYVYLEGGPGSNDEPILLTPDEVAHFAPIPDPEATYRGMSWLTPIVRDLQADQLMTRHRMKFFENAATPNMVIKHKDGTTPESIAKLARLLDENHAGVDNAYRRLHIGGGADVTVVGANLQQLEFHATQGHGETRIAAAAGVPPIIVGLSEGLEAATYSNYGQARRRLADITAHPLWGNAAGSFSTLIKTQGPGTRLWYDSRNVPFLREDEKDAAGIQESQARTIRTLVDGGYTPDSAQRAVLFNDFALLEHTGLFSVQLQRPGQNDATTGAQP